MRLVLPKYLCRLHRLEFCCYMLVKDSLQIVPMAPVSLNRGALACYMKVGHHKGSSFCLLLGYNVRLLLTMAAVTERSKG